jgi:hypothetical protein
LHFEGHEEVHGIRHGSCMNMRCIAAGQYPTINTEQTIDRMV